MKVTLVADSTFLFEHEGVRLLTDPWIGTTIYGGAWLQYPTPKLKAADIGRLDFIFISHIHEDHCDPLTLGELDRNATVLLMDRKPNFIEGFLKRHDFGFKKIVKVPAFEKTEIAPGLAVEMIDADPGHQLNHLIDSSLLLHWNNRAAYFANDNPPYPAIYPHLKKYRFQLGLFPASGGSGYPACYSNLSKEEKASERSRIQAMYLDTFVSAVETLRPTFFAPCAGYHVIAGKLAHLNSAMTFLSSPMMAYRYAAEKLSIEARKASHPLRLESGEAWDTGTTALSGDRAWEEALRGEPEWIEKKNRFLVGEAPRAEYHHERIQVPADFDWARAFAEASASVIEAVRRDRMQTEGNLYVKLGGNQSQSWGHLALKSGVSDIVPLAGPLREPYLSVRCDERLLYQLLQGQFSWNIADAGCLLEYARVPNRYDQQAFIALNHLKRKGAPKT